MTTNCAGIVCNLNVPKNYILSGDQCFEISHFFNKLLITRYIAKRADV